MDLQIGLRFHPVSLAVRGFGAYLTRVRKPRYIRPLGPAALLLEWQQCIDPEVSASVAAYADAARKLAGVIECVPAYASLLITFGPDTDPYRLRERVFAIDPVRFATAPSVLHRLPVRYGAAGTDLTEVSRLTGLSTARITGLHTSVTYRVYALGFRPGFAFLGELPAELRVPRRSSPRTEVPPGAVGLAERQTGVYPGGSPGGWQLVGQCPLPFLDTSRPDFSRFRVGDSVRFYAIDGTRFASLLTTPEPWPAR